MLMLNQILARVSLRGASLGLALTCALAGRAYAEAADFPDLWLQPLPPGNLYLTTEQVRLTGTSAGERVEWSTTDMWDAPAGSGVVTNRGGAFVIDPGLSAPGYYRITLRAVGNTGTLREVCRPIAVVTPHDTRTVAASRFGVQTHFAAGWTNDFVQVLARAGLKNIRDEIFWGTVEQQTNTFVFPPRFDNYMQAVKEAALEPMICLSFGNAVRVPDGGNWNVPHTPEQNAAYGRYAQEVLQHYGPQIHAVEVWNEYNGSFCSGPAQGRPEAYAAMLRAAYTAIKAVRPDVTVLGCATVHVPLDWIAAVIDANVKATGTPGMDAVSVHPYRDDADGVADELLELHRVIRAHNGGRDLQVWVTEQGWGVVELADAAPVLSRNRQARYLVRSWLEQSAADVTKSFWYVSHDYAAFKTMGVFADADSEQGRYAAHPTAVAYMALTRQLDGAVFRSREVLGGTFYHCRYEKDHQLLDALWATAPCAVAVEAQGPVTLTDMSGREVRLAPTGGKIPLWLSDAPIYLAGQIGKVAPAPLLTVTLRPTVARGEDIAFGLQWPAGTVGKSGAQCDVAGVRQTLQPNAMRATVRVPGSPALGERWIPFRVTRGDTTLVWGLAKTSVTEPVRIQDGWCFAQPGRLTVPVENATTGTTFVALTAHASAGDTTQTVALAALAIPPGAVRNIEIPLAVSAWTIATTKVSVALQSGQTLTAERTTGYHPVPRRTVTVDGNLDDWGDGPAADFSAGPYRKILSLWGGDADLSGTFRLCYDATNLYFAARVRDNVFSQTYSGWDAWKGDNIQIGISPLAPWDSRESGSRRHELGLSLTAHGPEFYRSFGEGPKGVLTGVPLAIRRDGTTTLYECAIPWSLLPGLGPDADTFSFGMFVNDNDGDGRRGYKEWGNIKNVGVMQPLRLEHAK